jgi:hypothetical protein
MLLKVMIAERLTLHAAATDLLGLRALALLLP